MFNWSNLLTQEQPVMTVGMWALLKATDIKKIMSFKDCTSSYKLNIINI